VLSRWQRLQLCSPSLPEDVHHLSYCGRLLTDCDVDADDIAALWLRMVSTAISFAGLAVSNNQLDRVNWNHRVNGCDPSLHWFVQTGAPQSRCWVQQTAFRGLDVSPSSGRPSIDDSSNHGISHRHLEILPVAVTEYLLEFHGLPQLTPRPIVFFQVRAMPIVPSSNSSPP